MKTCMHCGNQLSYDNAAFCDRCGQPQQPVVVPPGNTAYVPPMQPAEAQNAAALEMMRQTQKKKTLRKYNVFAIFLFIFFLIAGMVVLIGASEMAGIRSVAGDSIMEASYQGMGIVYRGIGIAICTLGAFLALVVHWLGVFRAEYIQK